MDGAALPPPHQVARWRWMMGAILLGGAGSLVALAGFAERIYRVGPLVVEMSVRPATSGTTELAVEPVAVLDVGKLNPGFAEAETHLGFLAVRATVIGVVGEASLPDAIAASRDPRTLATTIQEQGKDAMRRFGLRVGLLTLAGGTAGGAVIALVGMKTRRAFQGALAGVVLVGVLGLVAWQTYDVDKFSQTRFRPAGAQGIPGGLLPG